MSELALLRELRADLAPPSSTQRLRAREELLEAIDAKSSSPGRLHGMAGRLLGRKRAIVMSTLALLVPLAVATAAEGPFGTKLEDFAELQPLDNIPGEAEEVDHLVEGQPPLFRVEECRDGTSGLPQLTCELLIAVHEGELPPGEYSDEELEHLLEP